MKQRRVVAGIVYEDWPVRVGVIKGGVMEHKLVDDTLTREDDGVKIECTCGWVSRGHFTSMAASAAFLNHQEEQQKKEVK